MSDLLITYHVEDHLPAEAVALVEATDKTVDVYVSQAHPREVVAAVLGPLLTTYCAINNVEQELPTPLPARRGNWPRLIAAAVAPLAACAWLCELFLQAAAPVVGV